jgi:hypothetical protein
MPGGISEDGFGALLSMLADYGCKFEIGRLLNGPDQIGEIYCLERDDALAIKADLEAAIHIFLQIKDGDTYVN